MKFYGILKIFLRIYLNAEISYLWYNRWKVVSINTINTKDLNVHKELTTGQLSAYCF